jgi:hypothetical protein
MSAPHTPSETAAAYVEASQRIESSRHGAAGIDEPCSRHHRYPCWSCMKNQPTIPMSTVNAGIGFQMLMDRPDLAENVTRLRADGASTAHGVTLHVDGGDDTVDAWVEFLGPAAHVHPRVTFGNGWEQAISTIDTCVIVRNKEGKYR